MNNLIRHLKFALIPKGPILDIGSGGAPFWRANVLLDRYLDNDLQRPGHLIKDRPLICGDIQALPFLDNSFNFVHCSHVLEHIDKPDIAVKEMMRVSKAGYIETPSALHELILPFYFHRWLVSEENNTLFFREKPKKTEEYIYNNLQYLLTTDKIKKYEEILFIKYFWRDKIDLKIIKHLNPIEAFNMEQEQKELLKQTQGKLKAIIKQLSCNLYKYRFDYHELLACPKCQRKVNYGQNKITCENCLLAYPIINNIPIMLVEKAEQIEILQEH